MIIPLDLNENHLFFIQQFAKGKDLEKIKKKLNVDSNDKIINIKQEIRNQLLVTNDLEMIHKAYTLNLFEVDEYFLKNWKNIAFGTAYNIYVCRSCSQVENEDLKRIYMQILRIYVLIFRHRREN